MFTYEGRRRCVVAVVTCLLTRYLLRALELLFLLVTVLLYLLSGFASYRYVVILSTILDNSSVSETLC